MGNDDAKKIIYGSEKLDDDSLENVTGGAGLYMRIACSSCKRFFPADVSKSSIKCPYCGELNIFEG